MFVQQAKGGPFMRRIFGTTLLAVVVACGIPATAHHSNPLFFDMSKAITLEGTILHVEWINPHVLLFLQSKGEKGELETWVLHGRSLNNAMREVGSTRERLKPGTPISARVFPPRIPLHLNDELTVWPAKSDEAGKPPRIAGAGQIRFSNGDVLAFGGGPTF
jgi:hypothetical protein